MNVMYFSMSHLERTGCFTYPGRDGVDSGDGGDLWVLLVQGWTETNPGRKERDEERSLQTQIPNPVLPFSGAAAVSGDGEGLPRSTRQVLELHGTSIIPRKLASSSAGGCAHTCTALVVPQMVVGATALSPRAAPASGRTEEDPYCSLRCQSILRGWQGWQVPWRFCSRGDPVAICKQWDRGAVP